MDSHKKQLVRCADFYKWQSSKIPKIGSFDTRTKLIAIKEEYSARCSLLMNKGIMLLAERYAMSYFMNIMFKREWENISNKEWHNRL